ncbi:hypothetical protein J4208_00675 [Candidatus Woesearchaeota archaeon]|nr:hypothetical protein [Candidatus Woesearchaeota archaeon]
MQKKGDSQIISWVLLVGFVIGLAAIVTMWVKDRAESSTQDQIDQAEQELRCAETTLNVAVDCITPTNDITVTNTGKFTLKKVKFRQLDASSGQTNIEDIASVLPNGLPPQQTETLNTNTIDTLLAFEAIPIIALNEKEVVCVTKKVTHICP